MCFLFEIGLPSGFFSVLAVFVSHFSNFCKKLMLTLDFVTYLVYAASYFVQSSSFFDCCDTTFWWIKQLDHKLLCYASLPAAWWLAWRGLGAVLALPHCLRYRVRPFFTVLLGGFSRARFTHTPLGSSQFALSGCGSALGVFSFRRYTLEQPDVMDFFAFQLDALKSVWPVLWDALFITWLSGAPVGCVKNTDAASLSPVSVLT